MVQPCHKIQWSYKDNPARNSTLEGWGWGGRGRQKKMWEDNITQWTGLKLSDALRETGDRESWRELVAGSALVRPRSDRLRDRWRWRRPKKTAYSHQWQGPPERQSKGRSTWTRNRTVDLVCPWSPSRVTLEWLLWQQLLDLTLTFAVCRGRGSTVQTAT
jgi:hypothetical protein